MTVVPSQPAHSSGRRDPKRPPLACSYRRANLCTGGGRAAVEVIGMGAIVTKATRINAKAEEIHKDSCIFETADSLTLPDTFRPITFLLLLLGTFLSGYAAAFSSMRVSHQH